MASGCVETLDLEFLDWVANFRTEKKPGMLRRLKGYEDTKRVIVIENDADHAQAKALINRLMGSDVPQDRGRMVAQARLIEAHERTRWSRRQVALPNLLGYLMDQHGLSRSDLIPLLGTASRVSEVLSGKRELSMTMVRRLRERFQISADLLISPPRERKRLAA